MNDKILKKYLAYTNSEEAFAVLFVKKYLAQAKGRWVDIDDCRRYEMSPDNLHFRFVFGGLYERKIKPEYPSKSSYTSNGQFNESQYLLMVRAITWATAHKDIEQQRLRGIAAQKFKVSGVSYDKNKDRTSFFREDAPPEIKALANNLKDRTSLLWDQAMAYANKPEFVYEIKQAVII